MARRRRRDRSGGKSRFFAGSTVLAGQGVGEITATGRRTRFGNIARLVGEAELQATPLQLKTARVARWLIGIALGLSVVIFAVRWLGGAPPGDALLYAVTVAMSAVCEEMVVVLSLFLTLAALRLSREGVLVKRLASVETLGSTTVICLDKTGTLTDRKICARGSSPAGARAGSASQRCWRPRRSPASRGAMDSLEREILAHCREPRRRSSKRCIDSWRLAHDYPFDMVGKHMSHVWMRAPASDGATPDRGQGRAGRDPRALRARARRARARTCDELGTRRPGACACSRSPAASLPPAIPDRRRERDGAPGAWGCRLSRRARGR